MTDRTHEERDTESTLLYPSRIPFAIGLAVTCVVVAGVGLAAGAALTSSNGPYAGLLAGLFFVGSGAALIVIFRSYEFTAQLRDFVKRRPVARLDLAGFECALGRYSWEDVESLGVMRYRGFNLDGKESVRAWIRIQLRAGVERRLTCPGYYEGFRILQDAPRWRSTTALELPAPWIGAGGRVLETVRHFYRGPVPHKEERGSGGSRVRQR